MTPGTPPRRLLRLVLAVLLALAALAALEGALRLVGFEHRTRGPAYRFLNPEGAFGETGDHPVIVEDPELFWRLRPDVNGVAGRMRTNSYGFRTPEFEAARPADTYRIVVLGDSISFGLEVDEAAAWPRRLEDRLRARPPGGAPVGRVEVLNLGVPGYTSYQGRRLLERALAWSPDLVIACFGAFNDWVPAVWRTDAGQAADGRLEGLRLYQLAAWIAGRSPPGTEIRVEQFSDHPDVSPARRLSLIDTRGYEGKRRVPVEVYADNLRAMAASCRAAGASFALLAAPLPASTVLRNPAALDYRDAARTVAAELGCPLGDGWERFRASSEADDVVFRDFCHPSDRGHDLLAEVLAEAVVPLVRRTPGEGPSER